MPAVPIAPPADVAFHGVGRMGGAIAARLADAGFTVGVADPSDAAVARAVEAGCEWLDGWSLERRAAAVALVCVPGPVEYGAAVDQLLARGAPAPAGVVNLSTVGYTAAAEAGARFAGAGVPALEAPVSGGPRAATEGRLSLMASGSSELWAHVEPALAAAAARRVWAGETHPAAQMLKLVNNLVAATALAVTAEAVVLGEKAGIPLEALVDLLNSASGRTSASADKLPTAVVPRTYDYGFTVGLVEKDVALAVAEAEALGVALPAGRAVLDSWRALLAAAGPAADYTLIVPFLERLAGVPHPPPGNPLDVRSSLSPAAAPAPPSDPASPAQGAPLE